MAKRMREKALARKQNADKRPQATAKFVRISPSKVRIVLDIIRGKSYNDAMAILQGTPKAASEVLIKLLASAGANAEYKNIAKEDLFVVETYANEGPTYKRWWPRSHGSADQILKRTSHITIILDEKNDLDAVKKVSKPARVSSTQIDVADEAIEQVKDDVVKAKETASKVEKSAAKKTATKTATKKVATTKTTATKKTTTTKTASTKKSTSTKTTKGGAK